MLTAEHISSVYDDVQVLWDVSLRVEEGEFVALLGPNGAGKTTTLKTLAGLIRPRKGRIRFLDRDIEGLMANEVMKLGLSFVPEDGRLFEGMSTIENLLLGAYCLSNSKKIKQNLDYVFDLFPRLRERKRQLAGTLSGGERKMLAIARGLMSSPRLLLVDEPSLGLAPNLVVAVFDALVKLRNRGVTILLVEQNMTSTLRITDRAYVLEQGRIVLDGNSCDLLENDYVRRSYLGL